MLQLFNELSMNHYKHNSDKVYRLLSTNNLIKLSTHFTQIIKLLEGNEDLLKTNHKNDSLISKKLFIDQSIGYNLFNDNNFLKSLPISNLQKQLIRPLYSNDDKEIVFGRKNPFEKNQKLENYLYNRMRSYRKLNYLNMKKNNEIKFGFNKPNCSNINNLIKEINNKSIIFGVELKNLQLSKVKKRLFEKELNKLNKNFNVKKVNLIKLQEFEILKSFEKNYRKNEYLCGDDKNSITINNNSKNIIYDLILNKIKNDSEKTVTELLKLIDSSSIIKSDNLNDFYLKTFFESLLNNEDFNYLKKYFDCLSNLFSKFYFLTFEFDNIETMMKLFEILEKFVLIDKDFEIFLVQLNPELLPNLNDSLKHLIDNKIAIDSSDNNLGKILFNQFAKFKLEKIKSSNDLLYVY